ncbi:DNA alkylation repair protein [candidate division WOR_3 bacterium SM1_77]|uniref:DNA alkylation repair protein n=1 Tax=candidate division WOR_3 bacterium SM1_77 TaxID=1703778 RepID=A0A0S8K222_UNCW3|nr:MAG: DNA alkylation repair protein [candidate division WOR_3 bacterium SM1_77]
MVWVDEVIDKLKVLARPHQLEGMARYGMNTDRRLGVSIPYLRKLAKELGKDHELALGLWRTGLAEAKIVAAMIDEPEKVTEEQMEEWVRDIDSWDVCDQVCMNLFEKTPFTLKKIHEWAQRDEEFVRRTAFSLIACIAWHDKKADDEQFVGLFEVIRNGALDERNFVKKAVNWALRNIGKRNLRLNRAALDLAREIRKIDSRSARWIASDAIRELESEKVQQRLKH